jgi:hypothetical protein
VPPHPHHFRTSPPLSHLPTTFAPPHHFPTSPPLRLATSHGVAVVQVLVSAADSEASDVASARELEKAPDAEEPHHASHGVTPPHSASTSNQVAPPLATLLADDATTPDRRPPANVRNVSLEEQFECVSNHLVASAQRSAAASRAAATTTQQTPARGDAAAAASSKGASAAAPGPGPVTLAQALTLDWEEELLAEL